MYICAPAALCASLPRGAPSASVSKPSKPRRGRPPRERGTLTRERVVDAALALADRGGLESLSVRRLAASLGVTPMAVYNHVEDKHALLVALFDRVVLTYRPLEHDEPEIEAWLATTFGRMHRAMREHPSLASLLGAWFELGPGPITLDLLEGCLARLLAAGFESDAAVRAFYSLLGFTAGHTALAVAALRHFDAEDAQAGKTHYRTTMQTLAAGGHGAVLRLAPELAEAFDPAAFEDELAHQIG